MSVPKEGIYLDAALAVIGQQVDERIDELSRRRRIRARLSLGGLALFALASGSVAAVALATAPPPTAPTTSPAMVEIDLRCVSGVDVSTPAYFAVRYTSNEAIDPVAWCGSAWAAVAADNGGIAAARPAELLVIAAGLARTVAPDSGEIKIDVRDASFGRIGDAAGSGLPVMAACVRADDEGASAIDEVRVISTPRAQAPIGVEIWGARCATQGFGLGGGQ